MVSRSRHRRSFNTGISQIACCFSQQNFTKELFLFFSLASLDLLGYYLFLRKDTAKQTHWQDKPLQKQTLDHWDDSWELDRGVEKEKDSKAGHLSQCCTSTNLQQSVQFQVMCNTFLRQQIKWAGNCCSAGSLVLAMHISEQNCSQVREREKVGLGVNCVLTTAQDSNWQKVKVILFLLHFFFFKHKQGLLSALPLRY